MKPNNPFLISGYHSPEFFCDRETETETLLEALRNERNVTLIAPRRMGKIGLIRHAFYQMKEQEPNSGSYYISIFIKGKSIVSDMRKCSQRFLALLIINERAL